MIKFSLLYWHIKENLLMERISKLVKKITQIFKKDAEKTALDTKFKQRESKLTPEAFLTTFVLSQLINEESGLEDIKALLSKHYNIDITKQGLEQRFNDNTIDFFKSTFNNLLSCFAKNNLKAPEILKQFTNVLLLDSSVISLPELLKDIFPGFGGCASKSALRVQTLFDWTNNKLTNIDITPATKNDQGYKDHLRHLQKGSLLLQDLGYFDTNSFKDINDKGAYFISRFKSNTNLYSYNNTESGDYEPFNLVDYLKNNEGKSLISFNARIGADSLFPVRFVIRPVPEEVYQQRLVKAKKERKRGYKLQENTVYLYKWDIYITNISSEMISDSNIFIIYKLRWQIELLFKLCKSQAGIDKVAGKKQPRVICEIYAKLMLVTIVLYLTKAEVLEDKPEISLTKAFKKLKTFGVEFINALKSEYLLKNFLNNVLDIFSKTAIKEHKRKKRQTSLELVEALI